MNNNQLAISDKSKNLELIINKDLSFTDHASYILQRNYTKLKILNAHRYTLHKNSCDILVLFHVNYCDYVYGPSLSQLDEFRLQNKT